MLYSEIYQITGPVRRMAAFLAGHGFVVAAPDFPLATSAIAPLRARAESIGSGDFSPLWSGQNASGCKAISAAELTRELAAA